jgi:Xaa-Pro aminopeptidase
VLIDPAGTTAAVRARLQRINGGDGGGCFELVEGPSPVLAMKAKKNPRELAAMVESFRRADQVVAEATAWLNGKVSKGRPVNEAEFAAKVESLFREAGARSLSFRVIAAAGSNGAVIHYSHPDPTRRIKKGELVLLDTGAYFEPGYATDLTRTFLAGGGAATATPKQKLIYTLVLKASIRGLKARFPEGTTGVQLDAIVRAPIWEAGYEYLHGTGHGVGVLVHEFPPRVSNRSTSRLEPGQVFSIEPGIYLAGWGGVRIENLATVIEDPRAPGFLKVKALTFSALDRRLIDAKRLTLDEKQWLRQYVRGKG